MAETEPAWKREWPSWLRGNVYPGTIVIGPAAALLPLKAAEQAAFVRFPDGPPRVVTVGGAALLCLPGAHTGKWLPHADGGVLVRAPTAMTLSATAKGLAAGEQALAKVGGWQPVTEAWTVAGAGYAMRDTRAEYDFWTGPTAILDGTYRVWFADAKAGRFPVQYVVLARAGVTPDAVVAGVVGAAPPAPAVDTSLPAASKAEAAAARKQRWLSPAETSILLVDRAASVGWHGVFDARGKNAIAAGLPNDYERLAGQAWITIGEGKAAPRALVLDGPAPTTWLELPDGGAVVRHGAGELVASALGGRAQLAALPATAWKQVPGALVIGADGARLLDAAARGGKPRARDVLEIALPAGRYRVERAEATGAIGVGGAALEYAIELWRLRRT